jgi:hypothetical protein
MYSRIFCENQYVNSVLPRIITMESSAGPVERETFQLIKIKERWKRTKEKIHAERVERESKRKTKQ